MTVAQSPLTPPDQKWSVSSLCLSPVAELEGGVRRPPALVSAVRQVWAVGRRVLVDPPLEPGGDERDDDGHEVDIALVTDDVCVVSVVDEGRSGGDDVRRARGIVALVERRRA